MVEQRHSLFLNSKSPTVAPEAKWHLKAYHSAVLLADQWVDRAEDLLGAVAEELVAAVVLAHCLVPQQLVRLDLQSAMIGQPAQVDSPQNRRIRMSQSPNRMVRAFFVYSHQRAVITSGE